MLATFNVVFDNILVTFFYRIISLLVRKKENILTIQPVEYVPSLGIGISKKLCIIPSLTFMQGLIKYIRLNGIKPYISSSEITIENNTSELYLESWSGIVINYHNIKINIDSELSLTFRKKKNTYDLIDSNISVFKKKQNVEDIRFISDMITDTTTKNMLKDIVKSIGLDYHNPPNKKLFLDSCFSLKELNCIMGNNVLSYNNITLNDGSSSGNYLFLNIFEFLVKKLPNLSWYISLCELNTTIRHKNTT